jgi:hypothetical protein
MSQIAENAVANDEQVPESAAEVIAAEPAPEAERPGVAAAREVLSIVIVSPDEIAALLGKYPDDMDQIMELVAKDRGNAFLNDCITAKIYPGKYDWSKQYGIDMEKSDGEQAAEQLLGTVDVTPQEIASCLTGHPRDWDEITALVEKKMGPEFMEEVMKILRPSPEAAAEMDKLFREANEPEGDPAAEQAVEAKDEKTNDTDLMAPSEEAAPEEKAVADVIVEAAPQPEPAPEPIVLPEVVVTAPEPAPTPEPTVEQAEAIKEAVAEPCADAKKKESGGGWIEKAREYHRKHPTQVEAFNAATQNACVGADGELDPDLVATWQKDHGVGVDGRVGAQTVAAAQCGGEANKEEGSSELMSQIDSQILILTEVQKNAEEPIICSDADVPWRVQAYLDSVNTFPGFAIEGFDLVDRAKAAGQGHKAEVWQLLRLCGAVPFRRVTIQTPDCPTMVASWDSPDSALSQILKAYEEAVASYKSQATVVEDPDGLLAPGA